MVSTTTTAHGASPNDKPSAGYVSDLVCAECHAEISEQFRGHSMGRSLAPFADAQPVEAFGPAARDTFSADGFQYQAIRRGDELIHRQSRLAEDGSELAVIELKVKYVVGSGHHGRSYLVDRDGYLFMSPLTWYPTKGIWDLSPGFEKNNSEFNRPIIESCLFCHANRANLVAFTANHYPAPTFDGYAIGCQRCHGPGESHAALHGSEASPGSGDDQHIVNPAALAPAMREAVCQQCHLSGIARVRQPGRGFYDFRPGQPLDKSFAIFVARPDLVNDDRFVGQVEQMYESRCYQATDGRLGCISCHDPHRLPGAEERVEFYRERCLRCHATDDCTLAEPLRRKTSAADSCQDCHMPPLATEVRHASMVDHRIPRKADRAASVSPAAPADADSPPIVRFPPDGSPSRFDRDMAIALVTASASHQDLIETRHLRRAQLVLEQVTKAAPDDLEAFEYCAQLQLAEGQLRDGLANLDHILRREPRHEVALAVTADALTSAGDYRRAVDVWRRAIRVNPWMSSYWYGLARAYQGSGEWRQCQQTALRATERFPTSIGARHVLVESYLQLGERDKAEEAFAWLRRYNPRGMDALIKWYDSHPARR